MLSWVLLVLAASAAATLIDPTVPVFSRGKEYMYRYETQILTGIPEVSPQYSGMKIKTDCRIQFLETNLVTMKVENVKIYILNGDAIDVPPTTIIPDRLLTEMPYETAAVMIESLTKPIKFKYEKGLVHEIHAIEEDPFWSVNIKRGILNLININLTPDRVMEDREPSVMRDIFIKERKLSIDHTYKVKEPGIYGECVAMYGIMDKLPIPISHTERFLHVTKVVDTDSCEFSNIFEQGIFAGLTSMPYTPGKRPIIKPSIISDYILGGDRHRYWIKEAEMVAKYSFRPSMEGMTAMEGFVKQEMRFIEVSDVMQPLRLDRPMVELPEGLSLRMPTPIIPEMEPTYERTPEMDPVDIAKKVELAEAILENLITKLMVPMALDEECVILVKRLTLVLRDMPKMELKNIVMKYILPTLHTPVIIKKKAILLDILPTLPHPDLIEIMRMLIERRVITGPTGSMKIIMMTMIMHPTPRIIEELLTVCELPVVKSDVILRRSLMLGAGTMIHKMFAIYRKIGVRSRVTIRAFEPIITKMREILPRSSTMDEKIMWIKMVGNAGIPELVPEIESMVANKELPTPIRMLAIYSLRRMAPMMKKKILTIVLPIYMDMTEAEDLRIAAFVIILDTRPSYGVMHLIAHRLTYEPSLQLASFVHSTIRGLARSTLPERRPLSLIAKRVISFTRPVNASSLIYSKVFSYDNFLEKHEIGYGAVMSIIHEPGKMIPKWWVSKIVTHIFGTPIDFMEGGIATEGFDKITKVLTGPNGILRPILLGRLPMDWSTLFNPESRPPSTGVVAEELMTILSKLDLPTIVDEDMRIVSFMKLFGNELNYVDFTIDDIKSTIINTGFELSDIPRIIREGYTIDYVKTIPIMGNTLILPTPMGVPLTLNLTTITMATVEGHVKVTGMPPIRTLLTPSLWTEDIALELNIKPKVVTTFFGTLGVDATLFSIGTTIRGHISAALPVKYEIILKDRLTKIVQKFDIPQEEEKLFEVSIKPMCFVNILPRRPSVSSMYRMELKEIVPLRKVYKPIPVRVEIPIRPLGVDVRVEGTVPSMDVLTSRTLMYLIGAKTEIIVIYKPRTRVTEAIITEAVRIMGTDIEETSEEGARNSWWSMFSSEEERLDAKQKQYIDELNSGPIEIAPSYSEFMPIVHDPRIIDPRKIQYRVIIKTIGGPITDSLFKCQLTALADRPFKVIQTNVQMSIMSMYPYIPGPWKVMTESVFYRDVFYKWLIRETPRNMEMIRISLGWGIDSYLDNKVTVKLLPDLQIIPVDMMREWFPNVDITKYTSPPDERMLPMRMTIEVKPEIRPYYPIILERLPIWETTKLLMWPWSYYKTLERSIWRNKYVVYVEVKPRIDRINMLIHTGDEAIVVDELPLLLPRSIRSLIPLDLSPPRMEPIYTPRLNISKNYPHVFGECSIERNYIRTFDNITVPLNNTGIDSSCEALLARDCSSESLFTIVGTPIVGETGTRLIKIFLPKHKIEIIPQTPIPEMRTRIAIKVNDVVKIISETSPLIIEETIHGMMNPLRIEITTKAGIFMIKAEPLGVTVITDGPIVRVRVCPTMFFGKTCGLCGNFNMELSDDIRIIDTTITEMEPIIPRKLYNIVVPEIFLAKNVIPTEHCTVPRIPAIHREPIIPGCDVMTRHYKKDIYGADGVKEQICLSVEPMKVCPRTCNEAATTPKNVGFHCLPATARTTRRLLRLATTSPVIPELTRMPIDIFEYINEPQVCMPLY